jgi:hypothetical protein
MLPERSMMNTMFTGVSSAGSDCAWQASMPPAPLFPVPPEPKV